MNVCVHMGVCGLVCGGGGVTDCGPTDHRKPQETRGGGVEGGVVVVGPNMEQRVSLSLG